MTEQRRGRFETTWDELESAVHVPVEDQVQTQDVSAPEPSVSPGEHDEKVASGMAGGVPVTR